MKLSDSQVLTILSRCGYKSVDEVKNDTMNQLAKVVLSKMTIQQPKNIIPYSYSDVKSGPSVSDVHDFDDYEYVQRSFDRN